MTTNLEALSQTPGDALGTSAQTTATTALEGLVGDSKKFKTVEDLAKGKLESDAFILKLQEEAQTLRSLLEQTEVNKTRETLLQEILQTMNSTTNSGTTTTDDTTTTSNQLQQQLSLEDIVKVIEHREVQKQELTNFTQAMNKVKEIHGDKAVEFVEARAAELSIGKEELEILAKKSPKAFLNMLGVAAGKQQSAPISGVNSQAVLNNQQGNSGVRNKAYYDKMQSELGSWKFATNKNLQIQLHKDMQALGDAWYS